MAGADETKLKGLSKIFNGETIRGRANVSESTWVLECDGELKSFFIISGCKGYLRRPRAAHPVLLAEAVEKVKDVTDLLG